MERDDRAVSVGEATAPSAVPGPRLPFESGKGRSLDRLTGDHTPLSDRIEAAEQRLYYCLTGLERHARWLAAQTRDAGRWNDFLRVRLIASDVVSRMGRLDQAKDWQVQLYGEAEPGSALRRRAAVLLATTCDRRGERSESMHKISEACSDWPEQDHPGWRAEGLMVFAMMSISRDHVDYALAQHAVTAVRLHCSPLLLSVTLANFAEVAAECGDLMVAADFAAAAENTLREHPEVTIPLTLDSIARAMLLNGRAEPAIELLQTALLLERKLGCTDVQGDPWLTYAEALLVSGDAATALELLDDAHRARWAAKSMWTRSRDHKMRASVLAGLNRWKEAYALLLEHVEVYETVRSVESDRVTAESESLQVAQEERRRAERFEQLALTDALTGLANRRSVEVWLNTPGAALHVAIVDLDHFKLVNDTYSHAAGDLVLQRVAQTLDTVMLALSSEDGGSARVGRLGGEEFIIVWTKAPEDVAIAHADHLLDAIRAIRFPEVDPVLTVTASIGLAFHRTEVTGLSLLAEADRLLYVAKSTGRDQVVLDRSAQA